MNQKNIILTFFLAFAVLCGMAVLPGAKTALAQEESLPAADPEGQLTMEALRALNDNKAEVYTHDGRVTFIAGTCTADPVMNMEGAERVVESMTGLLGGDEKTRFEEWRTLTDAAGNQYYVFQQMYANTTVLGGAVQVITDPEI